MNENKFVCIVQFVDSPPLREFRSNPLMAIVQPGKIRPVLNMSVPKDKSVNDAIEESKLRKITMSTARKVSYAILAAGRHCTLSKYDLKDAYKNIPCHPAALRLQGFQC